MSFVIRKKQIILATLIVSLGVAVYLNWQYVQTGGDFALSDDAASQTEKNYGDAALVGAGVSKASENSFFTQARLEKRQARDESLEVIANTIKDSTVAAALKDEAARKAVETAAIVEAESKIEGLIKSKGFADCIAYITDEGADITVQSEGLLKEQVAQIRDIVLKNTKIEAENIRIIEIK